MTETLIMTEKADRTSLVITFVFQVLTAILEALSSFVSSEVIGQHLASSIHHTPSMIHSHILLYQWFLLLQ